ncbi:MAG TPA: DNA cytosine methyltransferase [Acidobacteriaceae bacterium]|nr:DNA cytosine methyltransferase [Acidobacteriaceae bacterium]
MNFSNNKSGGKERRPIGVDLFAGAGGLSLGFEQAGFDVQAAVEIDPIHCAVHEFNFSNCVSICANASEIDGGDIRKSAKLGSDPVDVVFGGAPCQGFSLIGKRALDDPRNRLLLEFVRLTVELDANYFVFENVKGLTIGQHRQLLDELIDAFHLNDYEILLPYSVLNAADFGVPQDRRRLFLVGAKKGLSLPRYPLNTGLTPTTVWEAIGDLPAVDDCSELLESDATSKCRFGKASDYARILRGQCADNLDFSYTREWDPKRLTSSLRTEHTPLSKRRFKATDFGDVEPVSRFLKLDPDGICNTLRAGTGSDRGAFTSPRPIHPHAPRCITVREAARLHSYPDWFRLHATKWHGFRQIGNSVPPLLGRAVASEIIRAMKVKPHKPAKTVPLGPESLLRMTMSSAARYYGVRENIVGKRLRPSDRLNAVQLDFAMA